MLRAKNITYSVAGRELLSDISVTLDPGKLHLVIGPNGAGKSTLIKVLARHLRPQKGSVEYDGTDIADASDLDLAKRRSVLSQAVDSGFPLLVRELVMMGRYPHFGGGPGPVDEAIVEAMMRLFEVTEFEARNYQTLSGGERQRANFARVLAQLWPAHEGERNSATRYLFLDEPLTFLDIRHQIDFMKKVRDFANSPDVVTVGVVHDLNLAARFADQIIVIEAGKIVAAGTPTEVLEPSLIKDVFGVETTIVGAAGGMRLFFE